MILSCIHESVEGEKLYVVVEKRKMSLAAIGFKESWFEDISLTRRVNTLNFFTYGVIFELSCKSGMDFSREILDTLRRLVPENFIVEDFIKL